MLAAHPAIEDLLLTSRGGLMRLIDATHDLYSSQLMASLAAAASKIHISSDLWTSPHRHGILAISARWVDQEYRLRRALLAMPECRYSHGGETQASLIMETLEKYGIASQVGYHVGYFQRYMPVSSVPAITRESRGRITLPVSLDLAYLVASCHLIPRSGASAVSRILSIYPYRCSFSRLPRRRSSPLLMLRGTGRATSCLHSSTIPCTTLEETSRRTQPIGNEDPQGEATVYLRTLPGGSISRHYAKCTILRCGFANPLFIRLCGMMRSSFDWGIRHASNKYIFKG